MENPMENPNRSLGDPFFRQVFVKICEESRRHRALLLDMGDESAKLKFSGAAKGSMTSAGGAGFNGWMGEMRCFEDGRIMGFW